MMMTEKIFYKSRLYFTIGITIAVLSLLIWDHFHGGVPTHHILQREDLPGFSNWWGGLALPLLSWLLFYRIRKRIDFNNKELKQWMPILYAFSGALTFGVLLSIFFTLGYTDLPLYLLAVVGITSFFFPIYRSECFLGSIVGMTFTFGGVLPIFIISIFSLLGVVTYLAIRPSILFLFSLFGNKGKAKEEKI